MTSAAQTISGKSVPPGDSGRAPEAISGNWERLRAQSDIQFEPIELPTPQPSEPGWLRRMMESLSDFLEQLFTPVGEAISGSWWLLQWILLAIAVVLLALLAFQLFGPLSREKRARSASDDAALEWQPDEEESLALLEEADRLASAGRYDEATHLLLKRSVRQIAAAKPDWVEPSRTARELAALPALPDAARSAFEVIAERVERSLFALRSLDRGDWDAARSAYAQFALARISDARPNTAGAGQAA
jgi:hypothetical protein